MKQSIVSKKKQIRRAHLGAEKERYLNTPRQPFVCIKEWNEDPLVIWQGTIQSSSLKKSYEVQIHYGIHYPFKRPKIFPTDKSIKNNRHQNPSSRKSDEPGDICVFQDHLNDWTVGTTCEEIINRSIRWFEKYEEGTLGDEPAPPEIERYYPGNQHLKKPRVIIVDSLTTAIESSCGEFLVVSTKSGQNAFALIALEGDEAITNDVEKIAGTILPNDELDSNESMKGWWYKVDREPFGPTPLVIAELISFIAENSKDIKINKKTICENLMNRRVEIIGICYPAQFSEYHWLIYQIEFNKPQLDEQGVIPGFRKQSQYKEVLRRNKGQEVKIFPTHHISKQALFRRVTGSDLQNITNKSVLLIGCGTIGSRIADTLIKAGLEQLILIDNDMLRVGNVCRHVLGLDYLGKSKAKALKKYLLNRNPYANIEGCLDDVLLIDHRLSSIFDKVDLVISCLGNDAIERWINDCAMNYSKPTFFFRTYAHATIGEGLLARFNRCCFKCVSVYLEGEKSHIPRPPKLRFEELVGFDADCGAPFIPASAVDIDLITQHFSRISLDFLNERDVDSDYWIVRGRPLYETENWVFDEKIQPPYTYYDYQFTSVPECDICRP